MDTVSISPIGTYHGSEQFKQQQPRQGTDSRATGYIELLPHHNFEQALEDLQGFSHIWILFQFHHNNSWKPKVSPPHSDDHKRKGVFATRSPHRPNPIGLSAVVLTKIEGRRIFITQADLLDGTPILDIKPYLPEADSFPNAKTGWVPQKRTTHTVFWSNAAQERATWLKEHDSFDFETLVEVQLALDPLNKKKRRLSQTATGWLWAFRTWRVLFTVTDKVVRVLDISSGYSQKELETAEDRYEDKELHRQFQKAF